MQIVVDGALCSSYALQPLIGHTMAVDRVVEYVNALATDAGAAGDGKAAPAGITLVTGRQDFTVPDHWAVNKPPEPTLDSVIAALGEAGGDDDEAIVYLSCDTPFLDLALSRTLIANHHTYFADVSFVDGYPEGVAPLVLTRRILPTLANLQEKHAIGHSRSALYDLILKDVNAFDVETELSPTDLRYLRLRLAADSTEGLALCRRFASHDPTSVDDIVRIAQEHEELLRILPAYCSIQVVEQEVQRLSYSPYSLIREDPTAPGREMGVDEFEDLVAKFRHLNPEGTVSLSLWGEISQHSDPPALIDAVGRQGLSLVCETSGVGWQSDVLSELASNPRPFLSWIIGLDATSEDVYTSLRGEGFGEAMSFVSWALSAYAERTYVQAVRLKETEEHLETFYKTVKERTGNVIIQKYDHFCGVLPPRKVTDISPVERRPCWHVKRDLVVLVDGTVPMCREDLRGEHTLGNALNEDLDKIWKRGEDGYRRHVNGDYLPICERCDEYYTFNF